LDEFYVNDQPNVDRSLCMGERMKIINMAVVLLAATVASADFAPASAQTRLRFAHFSSTEDPNHRAALEFAEKIKVATEGRFEVEIFDNSKLGGEVDVVEGIQLGTVDVAPPSAAVLANVIPEMNILNMPFLFRDWDHYSGILNGEFYDELSEVAAGQGIRILGFMTTGPRHIMSKFPIESMDDLKGKKIRTVQNPVHVATFSAFGANATAIAYPEVYGALQTGVVDGGDAANTNYYTAKFYEVAPHWAMVSWLFYTNPLVMSEDKFQSLSDADKETFLQIGREVGMRHLESWQVSDDEVLDVLKANSVKVTTPPREAFQAAVADVYNEFLKTDFEKLWLTRIRDAN
jgi:TRAP-type transport system periplasmic protein